MDKAVNIPENDIVEYCRQNKVGIYFDSHEEFLQLHALFGVGNKEAVGCGPLAIKWQDGICTFSHIPSNTKSKVTTTYRCCSKNSAYWLRDKDASEWITMQASEILELANISVTELINNHV